jgi:hypothetical protein
MGLGVGVGDEGAVGDVSPALAVAVVLGPVLLGPFAPTRIIIARISALVRVSVSRRRRG